MQHISPAGVEFLRQHEGLRLRVYKDSGGRSTIGYGHLIRADEDFSDGISAAAAEQLLQTDIDPAEAAVARLVKTPLSVQQFDALVSWTFNLGEGNLISSTMLDVLNSRSEDPKRYIRAAAEMVRWYMVNGSPDKGVLRRRLAEAGMFLDGTK